VWKPDAVVVCGSGAALMAAEVCDTAAAVVACFHPLQMLPPQGTIVTLAGHAVVCRLKCLRLLRNDGVGAATAAVTSALSHSENAAAITAAVHVSQPFYRQHEMNGLCSVCCYCATVLLEKHPCMRAGWQ
jgi:hypothetical protein